MLITPDINLERILEIETEIYEQNLSAIIVNTGGFAAYPSLIKKISNYDYLVSTIAHEWLHHYLIFSPLGRSYFKGGDMVSINETLADLFASEILGRSDERKPSHNKFRIMMKETRQGVDDLLENGLLDEAEFYMNKRKEFNNSEGYSIRKIIFILIRI